MFTKVTLNSFIFVINIFCTGPIWKFRIIGITAHHHPSFCLQYTHEMNEIGGGMKSSRPNLIQLTKILSWFKSSLMYLVTFFLYEPHAIKNHGKITLTLDIES